MKPAASLHLDHSLVQPMQLLHLDICQKYLDLKAFCMTISSSFNWLCITFECSLMWICSSLVLPSLCVAAFDKGSYSDLQLICISKWIGLATVEVGPR
jgi:hypothetical protein